MGGDRTDRTPRFRVELIGTPGVFGRSTTPLDAQRIGREMVETLPVGSRFRVLDLRQASTRTFEWDGESVREVTRENPYGPVASDDSRGDA